MPRAMPRALRTHDATGNAQPQSAALCTDGRTYGLTENPLNFRSNGSTPYRVRERTIFSGGFGADSSF